MSEKQVNNGLMVSVRFKLKLQLEEFPELSETEIIIKVSEITKEPGGGNCVMVVFISQSKNEVLNV